MSIAAWEHCLYQKKSKLIQPIESKLRTRWSSYWTCEQSSKRRRISYWRGRVMYHRPVCSSTALSVEYLLTPMSIDVHWKLWDMGRGWTARWSVPHTSWSPVRGLTCRKCGTARVQSRYKQWLFPPIPVYWRDLCWWTETKLTKTMVENDICSQNRRRILGDWRKKFDRSTVFEVVVQLKVRLSFVLAVLTAHLMLILNRWLIRLEATGIERPEKKTVKYARVSKAVEHAHSRIQISIRNAKNLPSLIFSL